MYMCGYLTFIYAVYLNCLHNYGQLSVAKCNSDAQVVNGFINKLFYEISQYILLVVDFWSLRYAIIPSSNV